MTDIAVKDLLPIVFERFNAAQVLWNLQIVVIVGVIGFLSGVKLKAHVRMLQLVLSLAYAGFAAVNLDALLEITEQRRVLADTVLSMELPGKLDGLRKPYTGGENLVSPPSRGGVILLHLLGDGFVLIAVLVLPRRRETAKAAPPE